MLIAASPSLTCTMKLLLLTEQSTVGADPLQEEYKTIWHATVLSGIPIFFYQKDTVVVALERKCLCLFLCQKEF